MNGLDPSPSCELRGVVLDGRRFEAVSWAGAVLAGGSLRGVELVDVDLEGADLEGVDLTGALLHTCRLDRADLTGARLVGATLVDVSAASCAAAAADLDDALSFPGWPPGFTAAAIHVPRAALPDVASREAVIRLGHGIRLAVTGGDLEEAARLAHEAAALAPAWSRPLRALGDVERRRGRPRAAVPFYERALALDGGDWRCARALARSLVEAGDGARGLALLRRVSAADPGDVPTLRERAWAAYQVGELDEAHRVLADAERLVRRRGPVDVDLLVQLAALDATAGRHRSAFSRLRAALEAAPGRTDLWRPFGELCQDCLGTLEPAADAYRRYLAHAAHDGGTWLRLAEVSLALGDAGAALDALAHAEARLVAREDPPAPGAPPSQMRPPVAAGAATSSHGASAPTSSERVSSVTPSRVTSSETSSRGASTETSSPGASAATASGADGSPGWRVPGGATRPLAESELARLDRLRAARAPLLDATLRFAALEEATRGALEAGDVSGAILRTRALAALGLDEERGALLRALAALPLSDDERAALPAVDITPPRPATGTPTPRSLAADPGGATDGRRSGDADARDARPSDAGSIRRAGSGAEVDAGAFATDGRQTDDDVGGPSGAGSRPPADGPPRIEAAAAPTDGGRPGASRAGELAAMADPALASQLDRTVAHLLAAVRAAGMIDGGAAVPLAAAPSPHGTLLVLLDATPPALVEIAFGDGQRARLRDGAAAEAWLAARGRAWSPASSATTPLGVAHTSARRLVAHPAAPSTDPTAGAPGCVAALDVRHGTFDDRAAALDAEARRARGSEDQVLVGLPRPVRARFATALAAALDRVGAARGAGGAPTRADAPSLPGDRPSSGETTASSPGDGVRDGRPHAHADSVGPGHVSDERAAGAEASGPPGRSSGGLPSSSPLARAPSTRETAAPALAALAVAPPLSFPADAQASLAYAADAQASLAYAGGAQASLAYAGGARLGPEWLAHTLLLLARDPDSAAYHASRTLPPDAEALRRLAALPRPPDDVVEAAAVHWLGAYAAADAALIAEAEPLLGTAARALRLQAAEALAFRLELVARGQLAAWLALARALT